MDEKQRLEVKEQIKKRDNKYAKYFQPDAKASKKRGKEDVNYHDCLIDNKYESIGAGKKYYIRTYGCQMNDHDTENMAGILTSVGYTPADDYSEADIIILNTCAIRENAENKVWGHIGELVKYKRENPELIIGVAGCMSQEEAVVEKLLKKYRHVDLIFGTHNIHELARYVYEAGLSKERVIEVWSKEGDVIENMPKARQGSIKAWVNISYGCDKFCSYCIVPQTRGKERSRKMEDIVSEVEELAANGYQEVTLLGQNVNSYGHDLEGEISLAKLLTKLKEVNIPRIRFTTSHPWDFTDELIDILGSGGNIMPYLHLPVQSGNSDILKMMNRKYTREKYLEIIQKVRTKYPQVRITTDIIVGFPNETKEQFEDTLSLYHAVEFQGAYTFIYSPRENTVAARMTDNIAIEEKNIRLQELNKLVNEYAYKSNEKMLDREVEVLVEGFSRKDDEMLAGYLPTMELVNFSGGSEELIGQVVKVKIVEAHTWHLIGKYIGVE